MKKHEDETEESPQHTYTTYTLRNPFKLRSGEEPALPKKFFDIDDEEIARQLTLIEHEMFQKVPVCFV